MKSGITVVTATLNRPELRRMCESVQAQTLAPDLHIILLEKRLLTPVPNIPNPTRVPLEIHWLPAEMHIVEAHNRAEELAKTPRIHMLDDDCWWEPEHLENLSKLMDETESDFVWSSSMIHDDKTEAVVGVRDDPMPAFQHIDTNEILFKRECRDKWGGFKFADHRGIDGRRIDRWVRGGAKYAHSKAVTSHYIFQTVLAYQA